MPCRSKQALLSGLRPHPEQKIQCGVCTRRCIFCDIWKLATLISTRIPISQRYASTLSPRSQHRSSRADSPTHQETFDWMPTERMIEAQFQTQRARLSSIMSICTVEGADQSEGLRMAHDRCLGSVKQLLYQESILEDTIIRSTRDNTSSSRSSSRRPSMHRMTSRDCGSYYRSERRPSRVGLAM
jgi:hypothetical protein